MAARRARAAWRQARRRPTQSPQGPQGVPLGPERFLGDRAGTDRQEATGSMHGAHRRPAPTVAPFALAVVGYVQRKPDDPADTRFASFGKKIFIEVAPP